MVALGLIGFPATQFGGGLYTEFVEDIVHDISWSLSDILHIQILIFGFVVVETLQEVLQKLLIGTLLPQRCPPDDLNEVRLADERVLLIWTLVLLNVLVGDPMIQRSTTQILTIKQFDEHRHDTQWLDAVTWQRFMRHPFLNTIYAIHQEVQGEG